MNAKSISEALSDFTRVQPNSEKSVLPEKSGVFAIALFKDQKSTDFDLIMAAVSDNIHADAIKYIASNRLDGFPGRLFYYFVDEADPQKNSEYLQRILPFCISDM